MLIVIHDRDRHNYCRSQKSQPNDPTSLVHRHSVTVYRTPTGGGGHSTTLIKAYLISRSRCPDLSSKMVLLNVFWEHLSPPRGRGPPNAVPSTAKEEIQLSVTPSKSRITSTPCLSNIQHGGANINLFISALRHGYWAVTSPPCSGRFEPESNLLITLAGRCGSNFNLLE